MATMALWSLYGNASCECRGSMVLLMSMLVRIRYLRTRIFSGAPPSAKLLKLEKKSAYALSQFPRQCMSASTPPTLVASEPTFAQMHLASTFSDDAQDAGMWHWGFDSKGTTIQ